MVINIPANLLLHGIILLIICYVICTNPVMFQMVFVGPRETINFILFDHLDVI